MPQLFPAVLNTTWRKFFKVVCSISLHSEPTFAKFTVQTSVWLAVWKLGSPTFSCFDLTHLWPDLSSYWEQLLQLTSSRWLIFLNSGNIFLLKVLVDHTRESQGKLGRSSQHLWVVDVVLQNAREALEMWVPHLLRMRFLGTWITLLPGYV